MLSCLVIGKIWKDSCEIKSTTNELYFCIYVKIIYLINQILFEVLKSRFKKLK